MLTTETRVIPRARHLAWPVVASWVPLDGLAPSGSVVASSVFEVTCQLTQVDVTTNHGVVVNYHWFTTWDQTSRLMINHGQHHCSLKMKTEKQIKNDLFSFWIIVFIIHGYTLSVGKKRDSWDEKNVSKCQNPPWTPTAVRRQSLCTDLANR